MPSNESFLDPTDLAMFASNRASVPLMSLLYSKEANAGQDYDRFAQQRAYEQAVADRRRDALVQRAIELRQQQELDARVPPEVQRWYMNSRYDPGTATRRADYAPPPVRNFGSPGTEMRAVPRGFQKGGKVAKTIQEMTDELLAKGTRTAVKDAPDIGRRALFGLRPQLDMPLARIHPDIEKAAESRLSKAMKDAPQETVKSVEVNPATGSIKSTLQSVAGTPLSRRTVLSATAGQALRHMMPGLDALAPGVGDIAKVADTVADVAAPVAPLTMQALIARAVKQGLNYGDAEKLLAKHDLDYDAQYALPAMMNPDEYITDLAEDGASRANILANIIGTDETKPMALRGAMRDIRRENPDMLEEIKRAINDAKEYGMDDYY